MSIGIDYGRGMTNIDTETGIRYGVISHHSPMPEALDDVFMAAQDSNYDAYRKETLSALKDQIADAMSEYRLPDDVIEAMADTAFEHISENAEIESDGGIYERDGYRIQVSSLGLYVIKSPFKTRGRFCSPCCPGAIDLDHPDDDGEYAYCLGADWFDGEKAPYPIETV